MAGPEEFAYDNAGNQTSAVGKDRLGNVLTSYNYTYAVGSKDTALRRTVAQADPAWTRTTTYNYDAENRLTQAQNRANTWNYSYDPNGNRCRTDGQACQGASDPYQYNGADQLTSSPGVSSFSYDGNGNLASSSAGASLNYNPQNQSTSITNNGQTLGGMAYANVDQTERTQAGAHSFASSPLGMVATGSGGQVTYFTRDNFGSIVGERTPDGNHWHYLKDALGSTVALIGNEGGVANRYAYDPYGVPIVKSETVWNPWLFAGGYYDETGFYKFGTRYYDPGLGRWTQRDSLAACISNPSFLNRYQYANDDPADHTDRRGTNPLCDVGLGLVAIGLCVIVSAFDGELTAVPCSLLFLGFTTYVCAQGDQGNL